MLNLPLLRAICEAPGVSGFERRIRELILREVKGLADDVQIDNMGNVMAIRRGKNPKRVMVGAHMDEIGFIVHHIDDKGFLRFLPLGGFDPKTLTAQRVIVHGRKDVLGVLGCKPIHIMKPEERKNVIPLNEYFVDTGMTKEEVEKWIRVGDPIGLDVTIAFDVPGSSAHEAVTSLGEGTAIKVLDGSVISDYRMVNYLKQVAGKEDIKTQLELLPAGGTDTAAIQRHGKKGSIAGAISIPLRNMHQSTEMAHKEDIENTIRLLTEGIRQLDTYNWDFDQDHGDLQHPDAGGEKGDFDWM